MALAIECGVLCLLFTLAILPAQFKDPLKMIKSYPPAIIKRVESLPEYQATIKQREKVHILKKIFGLLFIAIVLALVAWFSGCKDFVSALIHVFILMFSVNIFDLIVLDWGVFCHSKKLRIKGTEDMDKEYRNKVFHLRGAAVGTALSAITALLSGGIVQLMQLFI